MVVGDAAVAYAAAFWGVLRDGIEEDGEDGVKKCVLTGVFRWETGRGALQPTLPRLDTRKHATIL